MLINLSGKRARQTGTVELVSPFDIPAPQLPQCDEVQQQSRWSGLRQQVRGSANPSVSGSQIRANPRVRPNKHTCVRLQDEWPALRPGELMYDCET